MQNIRKQKLMTTKDRGSMFLRNVATRLKVNMALKTRKIPTYRIINGMNDKNMLKNFLCVSVV